MEFDLNFNLSFSSKVIISENSRKLIEKFASSNIYHNIAVLVDKAVYDLWVLSNRNDFLDLKSNLNFFIPGSGEEIKNINVYGRIVSELLHKGIERDSLIIALGGGALTDFAGFLASTFMRGIELILVPTTLLAQVDAAIGGKNGIDLEIKNAIGTFYLPKYVIIDPIFIETLPFEEYLNGLAEVVKYYIIKGGEFESLFKNKIDLIKEREKEVLLKLIGESVKTKLEIVGRDFKEENERMILNFGHTIGHAIESLSSYKIKHGFAIALGFIAESILANSILGFPIEDINYLVTLLRKLGFNFNFNFDEDELVKAILLDKKRRKGKLKMALPLSIGKFEIVEASVTSIKESVQKAKELIQKC